MKGTKDQYYFNKSIFRMVIVVLVFLFVYDLYLNNWTLTSKINIRCENGPCQNSLYNVTSYNGIIIPDFISGQQLFVDGFVYDERTWIEKSFGSIVLYLILLAFFLNHLLHNRSYDFKNGFKKFKKKVNEAQDKTFEEEK